MGDLTRFGISIDSELLEHFDKLIAQKGYNNRSESIRDLIRNQLVETEWEAEDVETAGTVTLVYNHESRDLADRLVDIQHGYHEMVVSSLHVHLDHHNCLEVLVLRGTSKKIRKAADQLISTKGVLHGRMIIATAGKAFDGHYHSHGVRHTESRVPSPESR